IEMGTRATALARAAGMSLLGALAQQAVPLMARGNYIASFDVAQRALEVEVDDIKVLRSQGYDSLTGALSALAWDCWALGRFRETACRVDETILRAATVEDPVTAAMANAWSAPLLEYLGDFSGAASALKHALALIERHHLAQVGWWVDGVSGWLKARRGGPAAGVRQLRDASTTLDAVGLRMYQVWLFAWLAEALALAGDHPNALQAASEGLSRSKQIGAHCYEAELLRLNGEALVNLGSLSEAVATFHEAMEVADRQGALTFKLRAAIGLAQSGTGRGRTDDRYRPLEAVLAQFDEDVSTPDLRTARTLLGGRD
ncbi:MAG: hypothetical protein AB7N65_04335, partial [Vicinamibacterales bacterium]